MSYLAVSPIIFKKLLQEKYLDKAQRLSDTGLAEDIGISVESLQKLYSGERVQSRVVHALCSYLKCTTEELQVQKAPKKGDTFSPEPNLQRVDAKEDDHVALKDCSGQKLGISDFFGIIKYISSKQQFNYIELENQIVVTIAKREGYSLTDMINKSQSPFPRSNHNGLDLKSSNTSIPEATISRIFDKNNEEIFTNVPIEQLVAIAYLLKTYPSRLVSKSAPAFTYLERIEKILINN